MATYFQRARAYAERVTTGVETAGKLERLACQRFLDDLDLRQATDDFPYRFDEAAGARACRFVDLMPHIKGEWAKPVYLDGRLTYAKLNMEDWQVFKTINLFGWVHVTTGLRRFRRAYEEVARKNAKSTWAAAVLLLLLAADHEAGAQVYSAATTGEQAREVFDVARNMADREPEFKARYGVTVGKHDITIPSTASGAKPLNAEGSTLDGLNIHGTVIDELHAHKTRALFDVIDSATGARSQPLILMITTAGSDRSGICYEQRDYTIKVLNRTLIDETWFGVIFTIDDGDLWHDTAVWRKSNPNFGVSVKEDDMQAACRKALATPSAQSELPDQAHERVGQRRQRLDGHAGLGPLRRPFSAPRPGQAPALRGRARPGQQGRRGREGEHLPRRRRRPLPADPHLLAARARRRAGAQQPVRRLAPRRPPEGDRRRGDRL